MFKSLIHIAACVVGLLLLTVAAHGQSVYLINVAETQDATVGAACQQDADNIAVAFYTGLAEGLLKETKVAGGEVDADGILKAIEQAPVATNDALVFFYAGHGGYDVKKKEHFLQMPDGAILPRPMLLGALKKKQARLSVVLTDSCANYVDTTAGLQQMAPSSPDPRRKTAPLFDELFFKTKGLVDINAAAPGELALALNGGGLFGLLLFSPSLYEMPKPDDQRPIEKLMVGYLWSNFDRRVTWKDMLAEMRPVADKLFKQIRPDGVKAKDGAVQKTQTITAFTLPEELKGDGRGSRFGVVAVANGNDGVRVTEVWRDYPGTRVVIVETGEVLSLEPGDVIVEVNGQAIASLADYWNAVKGSPRTMDFVIRNAKNGDRVKFRVRLRF